MDGREFRLVLVGADAYPEDGGFVNYNPGDESRYRRAVRMAQEFGLVKRVEPYAEHENVVLADGTRLSSPVGYRFLSSRDDETPIERLAEGTVSVPSARLIRMATIADRLARTAGDDPRSVAVRELHRELEAMLVTSRSNGVVRAGSPLPSRDGFCDTNVVSLDRGRQDANGGDAA